jgi:PIN domain nuclease of toxin-antitoxin system
MDKHLLADTHAILWYLSDQSRLSSAARHALELADRSGMIYISSITLIELQYLTEKGRLPEHNLLQLEALIDNGSAALTLAPVDRTVVLALRQIQRDIVPDMPDRIIAATGLALGLPIVTRDEHIQQAPVRTVW